MSAQPHLSVLMITYNHERYIAEALDSVLSQRTHFPFEIIIGEDCSTDQTRAIVSHYRKRFPKRITLLARERNIGMSRNFAETYSFCRGRYVALLEGDDYWTNPYKLQQQVDFLDADSSFSICYHDALVVGEHGRKEPWRWCTFTQPVSTLRDLIVGNYIPTCAAVVRNHQVKEFPEWFFSLQMADWPFFILNALHGKIAFLNQVMAHYRRASGIWSGDSEIKNAQKLLHACEVLRNQRFKGDFNHLISTEMFWCWCDLIIKYTLAGKQEEARKFRKQVIEYLTGHLWSVFATGRTPIARRLKTLIKTFRVNSPQSSEKRALSMAGQ